MVGEISCSKKQEFRPWNLCSPTGLGKFTPRSRLFCEILYYPLSFGSPMKWKKLEALKCVPTTLPETHSSHLPGAQRKFIFQLNQFSALMLVSERVHPWRLTAGTCPHGGLVQIIWFVGAMLIFQGVIMIIHSSHPVTDKVPILPPLPRVASRDRASIGAGGNGKQKRWRLVLYP